MVSPKIPDASYSRIGQDADPPHPMPVEEEPYLRREDSSFRNLHAARYKDEEKRLRQELFSQATIKDQEDNLPVILKLFLRMPGFPGVPTDTDVEDALFIADEVCNFWNLCGEEDFYTTHSQEYRTDSNDEPYLAIVITPITSWGNVKLHCFDIRATANLRSSEQAIT